MWACLYVILFILFVILSKVLFGSIKNPVSIFTLIWTIVGVGANLNIYEYYSPSDFVNFIIAFSILCTFFVYTFFLKGYSKQFFCNEIVLDNENIQLFLVIVVNVIAIVILIPYIGSAIKYILAGGFSYLRAQSSNIISNGSIAVIADSIIRPIFTATTIVAIVFSFTKNSIKKKIMLLLFCIVENIELVIITGGRVPIVNLIFYCLIALILFYGRSILNLLKYGKKYVMMVVVAVAIVIIITSSRNLKGGNNIVLYNLFVYYFSGPSYMTRLLDAYPQYAINGQHLYGAASFGYITNIWSDIMIFFTGQSQGSLYLLGSVITNNNLSVGVHTSINAMCTCFYPFLLDYGRFGILICPIMIAIYSSVITKIVYKRRNIFSVSLYVYWTYVMIRTVFKWDLVNIDFIVIIIILYLFTHPRKRKILIKR